jgi:hypothetical protein
VPFTWRPKSVVNSYCFCPPKTSVNVEMQISAQLSAFGASHHRNVFNTKFPQILICFQCLRGSLNEDRSCLAWAAQNKRAKIWSIYTRLSKTLKIWTKPRIKCHKCQFPGIKNGPCVSLAQSAGS